MVSEAHFLTNRDAREFSASGLRRYQNVSFVARKLIAKHSIPKKFHHFAEKQAEQIRHCLIQAEEYFSSSLNVTLATRPLLLYYSAMSFALAEILFEQDGKSSLDAARGDNAHHGLSLKIDHILVQSHELVKSASSLRAIPLIRSNGQRFGTFSLWHKSAKESLLAGRIKTIFSNGHRQSSFFPMFAPIGPALKPISERGVTFLDIICSTPGMSDLLQQHQVSHDLVRATISREPDHPSVLS